MKIKQSPAIFGLTMMDTIKEQASALMEESISCSIRIEGMVQGVGFRPFVVQTARNLGLHGWVRNSGGQVDIAVKGSVQSVEKMIESLKIGPPMSHVQNIYITEANKQDLINDTFPFSILDSVQHVQGLAMPPPDLSVCHDCLEEMQDPGNRRYKHPFISCTACGPRYSILESLPYDRETTTMLDFDMCPDCKEEYENVLDRRYHAQTISCHSCGPGLILKIAAESDDELPLLKQFFSDFSACDKNKNESHSEVLLSRTCKIIKNDGIVAVKGIGGYHLLCNPFSDTAVNKLRKLKQRDAKPFAVVFPNLDTIKSYCFTSSEEESLLSTPAHPIVLLTPHREPLSMIRIPFSTFVSNQSRYIGGFLPYTPLLQLLTNMTGPLTATSANLSGYPIVSEDSVMEEWLNKGLDAILYHHRRIAIPQDDSVAWVINNRWQLLRRARGYAPLSINLGHRQQKIDNSVILALGSQQKANWVLSINGNAYLGEYLGDLNDYSSFLAWQYSSIHASHLLNVQPNRVVCDLHPRYLTKNHPYVQNLPKEQILRVQHHHAHIAAVMAEHNIIDSILGVSFDGTGYGTDGSIWGGEFFLCYRNRYERLGSLKPIQMIGGDSSVEEGWKSLLCNLQAYGLVYEQQMTAASHVQILLTALEKNINTVQSSSMGRLFDAVSSLLGLCQISRYEGEGASLLEKSAYQVFHLYSSNRELVPSCEKMQLSLEETEDGFTQLNAKNLWVSLLNGIDNKVSICVLALQFHIVIAQGVILMLNRIYERVKIKSALPPITHKKVALSGGVFQNRLLLDILLPMLLENGYTVHLHEKVPPNDGGLSLGQAYVAFHQENEEIHKEKAAEDPITERINNVCSSTRRNYKNRK